jgi:hypothetical protein
MGEQHLQRRLIRRRPYAKRRRDRVNYKGGIANRCQPDKADRTVRRIAQSVPDLQRRLRLPDATRPRERDEPMLAYERCDLFELGLSPDETGQRERER